MDAIRGAMDDWESLRQRRKVQEMIKANELNMRLRKDKEEKDCEEWTFVHVDRNCFDNGGIPFQNPHDVIAWKMTLPSTGKEHGTTLHYSEMHFRKLEALGWNVSVTRTLDIMDNPEDEVGFLGGTLSVGGEQKLWSTVMVELRLPNSPSSSPPSSLPPPGREKKKRRCKK